jgi:hypothetical protein
MEHDADRTEGSANDASALADPALADPAHAARAATRRLVADVARVGRLVHDHGVVGEPVPVRAPDQRHGQRAVGVVPWFVPVTAGERLAGFALVDVSSTPAPANGPDEPEPAARIRRWSTFQRHEGDLESCPEARLWTDLRTITATAAAALGAGGPGGIADAGEPVLTWERSPEHLVWEVTVDGRSVHVAGSSAWPA